MKSQTLRVNEQIAIPLREFDFSFARSQGPGGQNVNKVNSKVTLRWNPRKCQELPAEIRVRMESKYRRRFNSEGEIIIDSQRYRNQGRNIADCIAKLQEMIRTCAVRPKVRRPTKPSKSSIRRRLENKQKNAQKKQQRRSPRVDD